MKVSKRTRETSKPKKDEFMTMSDLRDDKIITNWLADIGAADNTTESYLSGMKQFTDYTKKTPQQLIQEAEAEIKSGLLMRERNVGVYLREFRKQLEDRNVAPLTLKNRMNAVCSFYNHYEIQLPALPRNMQKAKPELKRNNKLSKGDIQEILEHADLLERAVILVGVSSGLSVNEIINLKVRDFYDSYNIETGITTLHLIRQKTKFEFVTFLTPEASKAVKAYLDYRERKSTTNRTAMFNQLKKQRIILDKDGKPSRHGYLFVARIVPEQYHKVKNPIEKEELRKLDRGSILAMYRRLNEEAQKSTEHGEWNIIRSHNVRKYFFNQLDKVMKEKDKLEFMMAHEVEGSKKHYKWNQDPTELLEEYKKHMHVLMIEKEFDPTESLAFQVMVKENAELKQIAATATVENEEIKALRVEIENLKEEKQDMTEAHWESEADHMLEEKVSAHYHEEDMQKMQEQLNRQSALIAALTKTLGLDLDLDKPLTDAEKKALKKTDW